MKRLGSLLPLTLVAALLFGAEGGTGRRRPLFPDKALEGAVREELKKGDKEELKEDDLKNLYFLRAKSKKIASLAGLEKCTNVELIDLAGNAIADLKPSRTWSTSNRSTCRRTRSSTWPPWPRW